MHRVALMVGLVLSESRGPDRMASMNYAQMLTELCIVSPVEEERPWLALVYQGNGRFISVTSYVQPSTRQCRPRIVRLAEPFPWIHDMHRLYNIAGPNVPSRMDCNVVATNVWRRR